MVWFGRVESGRRKIGLTMKRQLKLGAFLLLSASLFYGFAARAQGQEQTERVAYALTLIDAGADGAGNTKTGGPVTEMTTKVRLKVTVSVPRHGGSNYYGPVPTYASPARLMFRKHRGPETAFDGTLTLTQDAPYTNAAATASASGMFYPMPQADAEGVAITDARALNLTAVASNAANNLAGEAYADYLGLGQAHDLARWEATYLTKAFDVQEVLNTANDDANLQMVRSLLTGEATYEWFVASRRGLGSVARISDIQDHGRHMTCTDVRLWTPTTDVESVKIEASSRQTLGKYEQWALASMPADAEASWQIFGGMPGSNWQGEAGVQLLNFSGMQADYSDAPRLESPVYPDGVSAISFDALTTLQDAETDSTLLVQVQQANGGWTDLETLVLTAGLKRFTVNFGDALPEGSNGRFRLVRTSENASSGAANMHTYVIRNLLVRSSAPKATFGDLLVQLEGAAAAAEPYAGEAFSVRITAEAEAGKLPRGYKGEFRLRRRVKEDASRTWYSAPAEVAYIPTTSDGALVATFRPGALLTNPDGSLNVRENAFFVDANGHATGMLAGVYDVVADVGVLGSYAAGRTDINGYETVTQSLDGYTFTDGNGVATFRPYVLNVREQPSEASEVFLRVMYRTGTSVDNYDLETFDVPLLPSAAKANVWRTDLSKLLRLPAEIEAAVKDYNPVYAWGYEPDDPAETAVFDEGYISFKIGVTTNGVTTWYGQNAVATSASTRPGVIEVVPSVAETLGAPVANEAQAVPLVVEANALPNSHLLVEVNLADKQAAVVNLAGSFWQDFNTWDPSERFCETEFRENVTSVTADFDCSTASTPDETILLSGWIPDEGPLADTTAILEKVNVGRQHEAGSYAFILPPAEYVSDTTDFASWGASHEWAAPSYLRAESGDSIYSDFLEYSSRTEVVLRREGATSTPSSGNVYRPDALFRLSGLGSTLSPRDDTGAHITLKGVGKVSFTLGMSLPYDIDKIAEIITKGDEDNRWSIRGRGLSASLSFDNPSLKCAPSGYSASFYLTDKLNGLLYEMRLTQLVTYPSDVSTKPTEQVVMELYRWQNGTAVRQTLQTIQGQTDKNYYEVAATLSGNSYAIWVMADGRIAMGQAGTAAETFSPLVKSKNVLVNNPTTKAFNLAFGSAECRPIFRNITRALAAADNYSGSVITSDQMDITTPSAYADGRNVWNVAQDPNTAARVQLSRSTPSAITYGHVKITARGPKGVETKEFYTDRMNQFCEVTLGMANATLTIEPYNEESNVFIDNISVSSWCGTDGNRNGRDRVPAYTDVGFASNTGFAAVGAWIRAEEDAQLKVLPSTYNGKQCLLLQRSRQNNTYGFKETETDGVKHTGNAMALYLPFSEVGYGPVSFRYRIPQMDEYGDQGELPSAWVMLQYTDDGPYSSFLGTDIPGETEWDNVSQPVELRNTGGEWSMISITPKLANKELVGVEGTLRLVMVIPNDMKDADDPYVYIDDVRVTTNETGTSASWSATNVRVAALPVNQMYWKDRLATEGVTPPEETFAQKQTLTRAMQLNDVTTDELTEGTYTTTVLKSPILEEGAGRVTFAARLAEPQTKPVRLYLCATDDTTEAMKNLQAVTYVEVTNTVYSVYDIDLSKYRKYGTVPNADGSPSDNASGGDFSCSDVRRLTLKAFVAGDGASTDGFGATPVTGRVWVDHLAVSNPVLPSIRVASVAFSNLPGTDVPAEFNARSPLSQPVKNASILRTMVRLDRAQLLKQDSIRVFLTVDPHSSDANGKLKRETAIYSYDDVLGGMVSASAEHPIYTWDQTQLETWPLAAWFDRADIFTKIKTALDTAAPLSVDALEGLGIANTVELHQADPNQLCYYGDLTELSHKINLLSLPENSLVRYNAWAVYQSEETDQWFFTQIQPSDYTEYPWYFPRSLNAELRTKAAEAATTDEANPVTMPASFFSPYYWVYSYLPGEAFINEFNFNDNKDATPVSAYRFVEICAPSNTSLCGWRVEMTDTNSAGSISSSSVSIAPDDAAATLENNKTLPEPDLGAVPYQRKDATSAQRSFYTAFSSDAREKVYYREDGEKKTDLPKTKNAGIAEHSIEYWESLGSGLYASSVRLHRPTGGAEHIVCFTLNGENNAANEGSVRNLNNLYNTYRAAYVEKGFGGEWQQTFTTGSWADYTGTAPDAFGGDAAVFTAEMHGRRLVKADTFVADGSEENRFTLNGSAVAPVNDLASSRYSNSIATVDMGGIFVTRKDAINENVDNGPLDLTDVTVGKWPIAVNPTAQTRISEPASDKAEHFPVVQVTPRQINPDQYLILYSGFSSSVVTSELSGRLGSHTLEMFDGQNNSLQLAAAGRTTPQTWSLSQDVASVKLTYTAFPFHTVGTVTLRLKDASDPAKFITDVTQLAALITVSGGTPDFAAAATADGWFIITPDADITEVAVSAKIVDPADAEVRYSLEASAAFELMADGGLAREVITQVSPYCGEGSEDFPMPGSAKYQPWWGSNYGFEVAYDDAVLNGSAVLSSLIVTYPSPTALANAPWSVEADWSGVGFDYQKVDPNDPTVPPVAATAALEGMEYAEAVETLKTVFVPQAGTRYVEITGGANGRFADASAVAIPGDAYAKAMGYDPANPATAHLKEPAIPFCVWGVYTVTLQTSRGNEKVSFLMRQAMPGEKAGVWTYPAHYAPAQDRNDGIAAAETLPYFYLYSTPPQSAWLNEVNLVKGTAADAAPFAEVVFPVLREGILSAANPSVAQADPAGWTVRRYTDAGALSAPDYPVAGGVKSDSSATSYDYYTLSIDEETSARTAYVLHRPCGAAEGGVWTGVDANGNAIIAPPEAAALTANSWLVPPERSFVVAGKSDASTVAGSVQLVGKTVLHDDVFVCVSSAIADRTEWAFAATTAGSDNEGARPDIKPVWNQVTITSALRNTVYAGVSCGYQLIPGTFDQEGLTGETDTVTLTKSGSGWKYTGATDGIVLSYRPRANYRFEAITLPAEMIGKVMLIGRRASLSAEIIAERVAELQDAALLNEAVKMSDWLTLEGRALVEMHTVVNENGVASAQPTGKILFDTTFYEGEDEKGNALTFGDLDDYVISLVFIEEPASAQNSIEVSLGQGEVKAGAWMVSQTLYALKEDGSPDEAKGGEAVTLPIWSDETGNKNGDYANLHGWLHQPITGETIGMTAVINPDLGLQGGKLADPAAAFAATGATLRPFLVWTAIPKSRVPTNLFDASQPNQSTSGMTRNDFIKGWGVHTWLGSPSVQDGVTMQLSLLRQKLLTGANSTAATALYSKAGIIPMTYTGYCDQHQELSTLEDNPDRPADTLLAFRTMTAAELAAALQDSANTFLSNANDAELPYTSAIDMTDAKFWQDGAILRFAVVIADAATGLVYDCQSVSNFTSDAFEAYCPWYIPEATTNINAVTASAEAGGGVSPFAWVYSIPQSGVWINEFRPFAIPSGTGAADVASAFELAMYASPLVEDVSDPANLPATFTPTRTLDGWKVVTRYAPMPKYGSDPSAPIAWQTHKEVELKGWIPYRRIRKSLADSVGNPALYESESFDLDFYTAVPDPSLNTAMDFDATVSITDPFYRAARYRNPDGTTNDNSFQWYNFNLKTEEQDYDLFEAGLQQTLVKKEDGAYAADGVLYSIILVRNNGAVEDEVLFYSVSPYAGIPGYDEYLLQRLDIAVKSEVANNACAGAVRVITSTPLPRTDKTKACPVQFLNQVINGTSTLGWWVASSTEVINSTFSKPNTTEVPNAPQFKYYQPYVDYALAGELFAEIKATMGGIAGATLKLSTMGNTYTGSESVQTWAQVGKDYHLSLEGWNTKWYALEQVTCNNQPFTPVDTYALATTYALNASAQTYATTTSFVIASEVLTQSVNYNLVFGYTPEAETLVNDGALDSDDPGFLEWVQQADPDAVAAQSAADGITAAEKYWLGVDTPDAEAKHTLDFTYIGKVLENPADTAEKPVVSLALTDGTTRVTTLQGDGNVVLMGKKALTDAAWIYLKTLAPADLAEGAEIFLTTDCKFFRAKLMSDAELEALVTAP